MHGEWFSVIEDNNRWMTKGQKIGGKRGETRDKIAVFRVGNSGDELQWGEGRRVCVYKKANKNETKVYEKVEVEKRQRA